MLNQVLFSYFLGIPWFAWGGIVILVMLVITAILGRMATKGKVQVKTHKIFVAITIILAATHATLGILAFIK